jgi:hypothetical protein
VLFLIYALTTGRFVGWEDSAFLQTASATLGVPHGPGFPLYVLAGHVWSMPFDGAAAWGSNLFSAAAMAAVGVLLLEVMLLLARHRASAGPGEGELRDPWVVAAAIGAVLAWGTLDIIWQQAVRTEVYALSLLLCLATAYLSLLAVRTADADAQRARRLGIASCFTWGLAMTVHPLVACAGATPWLVPLVPVLWRRRGALAMAIAAGALPALLYLYPLMRGRLPGVWAWGAFGDWHSALDYYLRRSAWAAVPVRDGYLWENVRAWLFAVTNIWPAAITFTGLLTMIWLRRAWALPLSTLLVLGLLVWAAPFAVDNLDLWGYFLPAGTFLAAACGVFVITSVRFLRAQMPGLSAQSREALGFFSIALLLGWPAVAVYSSGRAMSPAVGAGGVCAVLAGSLPQGALVLAADDNLLGPLNYAQRVEGLRPDLSVVALGALRYPFYRDQVRELIPDLPGSLWYSDEMWTEVEWGEAIQAWLQRLPADRPVYTQYDALPGVTAERLYPAGFVYALAGHVTPPPDDAALYFWLSVGNLVPNDPVGRSVFARWQFNFGAFAGARGLPAMSWDAVNAALETTPSDPEIYFSLGKALERGGQMREAEAMYRTSLELAPYRDRYQEAADRVAAGLEARS